MSLVPQSEGSLHNCMACVLKRKEPNMAGYRKLGRTASQRKALLRNQVTNLLYKGKIVTTEAKAK